MNENLFFKMMSELEGKSFPGLVLREARFPTAQIAYEPLRAQYEERVRMTVRPIGHPELPSYLRFEQGKLYGGDETGKEDLEIDDEPDLFAFQLLDPRMYLHLKGDFWVEGISEQPDGLWRVECKYRLDSSHLNLDGDLLEWVSQHTAVGLVRDLAFWGRAQMLQGLEQTDLPPYELDRIVLVFSEMPSGSP